ncbi:cytochrome C oxidase subunit IV family protein, partial [Candidatus Zixiibacteriota bacterium]
PLSLYLSVGLTLLGLTIVTVWVAQYDLGSINLLVAMLIAAVKVSLVAMFFMHLKYDNKLYLVAFLSAIFFLAVFIIITMFDTLRRGDIDSIKAGPIIKEAVIYQKSATNDSTKVIVDTLSTVNDSVNNDSQ